MIDLRKIHDVIIDNPDFNITVAAKRDLRELCAWIEIFTRQVAAKNERIAELETENERLREAAQDFVDKVECGQGFSRSKVSTANSYAKFKKALEDSDEL